MTDKTEPQAERWTPGPWTTKPSTERATIDIMGADSDAFIVAEAWDYATLPGRTMANASLISAAPDLFAALAEAMVHLQDFGPGWDRALAALLKARGDG